MVDWQTAIDQIVTRDEVKGLYGGAKYGGIEPSKTTPNVMVYSDPEEGAKYGYNFDGWDDASGLFLYTGMGKVGDQVVEKRNRSLLDHAKAGRALRLFVWEGFVEGKKEKTHRYVGEFSVDGSKPYTREDALDENGEERSVLVFRLQPIGEVGDLPEIEQDAGLAETQSAVLVPIEASNVSEFEQSSEKSQKTAKRRESELVSAFDTHLQGMNHETGRFKLRSPETNRPMHTDIFDATAMVLYEAKGASTRESIRMAIGQLFDYRRYIETPVELSVLLPTRPGQDMIELLASLSIGCTWQTPSGGFETAAMG